MLSAPAAVYLYTAGRHVHRIHRSSSNSLSSSGQHRRQPSSGALSRSTRTFRPLVKRANARRARSEAYSTGSTAMATKTVLLTGATDGIGLETAKQLASAGHRLLLHGRNESKLDAVRLSIEPLATGGGIIETYVADMSRLSDVERLAKAVSEKHEALDVIINNAGVLKTPSPFTPDGFDVRFLVNTVAPYLLTKRLLPLLAPSARVVNLSSAAQAPVNLDALAGRVKLSDDMAAYAQSKLALTMWSHQWGLDSRGSGPMFVAVNPGSFLGTKMVKEGFGMAGKDTSIGAEALVAASLSDHFAGASGRYFDNDSGMFSSPHPDGEDSQKCRKVIQVIEDVISCS